MNTRKVTISLVTLVSASFICCMPNAFAELNTHSSSESCSEASSSAGSYNAFPVIGGHAILTPLGAYSEQGSSPNPYFKRKIELDKSEMKPEHKVIGEVKNYYWPSTPSRSASIKRSEKRM